MKKIIIDNLNNLIFMITLLLIFLIGLYSFVKEPILYTYFENRGLTEKPRLYINNYLSGKFQSELEASLSDQFINSQNLKIYFKNKTNYLDILNIDKKVCKNNYIAYSEKIYTFNCKNHLLKKTYDYDEMIHILQDKKDMFNYINNKYDVYYYFIEDSNTYNFKGNKCIFDFEKEANKIFSGNYHIGKLKVDNIDLLEKYFYKSDHHWNDEGAREGYKEIINLIYPDETTYEPIGKYKAKNYKFYGSNSKQTRKMDCYDEFWAYKYDLPKHTTIINRKNTEYGLYKKINSNKNYKFIEYDNPYAIYYGADYGEIIYDYQNKEKENILILSNSYSNPVNKLIAAHFNKTYIVDNRHYKNDLGVEFNIDEYIENNNINKILILANLSAYYNVEELNFKVGD